MTKTLGNHLDLNDGVIHMSTTLEKTDRSPSSFDVRASGRITATESIAGRRCIITLERDEDGHYREVEVATLDRR